MMMMNSLTLMQEQVRKFLAAELLPHVDQYNEDGTFPDKAYRAYFKAGSAPRSFRKSGR